MRGVNTSSIAGLEGIVSAVSYSTLKAGANGMALPLAREFARDGLRVLAIAPGFFQTPLAETVNESTIKQFISVIPTPKSMGRLSEFAALVRYICDNDILNGEVMRLDAAIRVS